MHLPGGIEHQDGEQIVRGPARDGPCFFIREDKLIWLDKEGKPSGEEETVTIDPAADPKRIKFTKKGARQGTGATGGNLRSHGGRLDDPRRPRGHAGAQTVPGVEQASRRRGRL